MSDPVETPEQRRSREAMEHRWDKADTPAPKPTVTEARTCPHPKRKLYMDGKCRECFTAPFFDAAYTIVEIIDLTGFTYPAVTHRLKQMGIVPKAPVRGKEEKGAYLIERKRPLSKRAYQMPMPNYVSPTRRDGGVKKNVFAPVASVPSGRVGPRYLNEDDDF